MKRNSKAYRLQLIKETAQRHERATSSDPMVRYISQLQADRPHMEQEVNMNQHFAGYHYSDQVDGWISDDWS